MIIYTVDFGDQHNLSSVSAVGAVRDALAAAVANDDDYQMELVRDPEGKHLVRVWIRFAKRVSKQARDAALSKIARISNVAAVYGENYFAAGPARGKLMRPSSTVNSLVNQMDSVQRQMDAVVNQFTTMADQVQFIGEPFNPGAGLLSVDIPLQVTDDSGRLISVLTPSQVDVVISGGSATGAKIVQDANESAIGGSLRVDLTGGKAVVQVVATSTGNVNLSLANPSDASWAVFDTAVVTFS